MEAYFLIQLYANTHSKKSSKIDMITFIIPI